MAARRRDVRSRPAPGEAAGLPRPGNGPAAFTLIELLVVLVILGMATAVVAPALRPPAGRGAAHAAENLAAAYAAARSAAVGRGVAVTVEVDLISGSYRVLAAAPDAAPDTMRVGALALPPGARMRGGRADGAVAEPARWRAVAVFDPLGRAHGERIVIEHDGRSYAVEIDAWTAAARVVPR